MPNHSKKVPDPEDALVPSVLDREVTELGEHRLDADMLRVMGLERPEVPGMLKAAGFRLAVSRDGFDDEYTYALRHPVRSLPKTTGAKATVDPWVIRIFYVALRRVPTGAGVALQALIKKFGKTRQFYEKVGVVVDPVSPSRNKH